MPQIANLGIGAIQTGAVISNEATAIPPMAYVSLSFHHRVIDGATADQFMVKARGYRERSHGEQVL